MGVGWFGPGGGGGGDFQESGTPFDLDERAHAWSGRWAGIFLSGGQGGIAPLEFWQPKKVQTTQKGTAPPAAPPAH